LIKSANLIGNNKFIRGWTSLN